MGRKSLLFIEIERNTVGSGPNTMKKGKDFSVRKQCSSVCLESE